jgi:uncharacterized protein involved in response to NO
MLQIEQPFTGRYAFLHTGFRPFFALATVATVLLMLIWLDLYSFGSAKFISHYPPISWHAHEMIYGFGLAIVAGFLLTAVKNWTQIQTITGYPLLVLSLTWVLARVFPFCLSISPLWAAGAEITFLLGLLYVITKPILQAKQWGQLAVIGKVALIIPASAAFHLGVLGTWPEGVSVGLYAGVYLILGLVLTLARRVMPMFIERGINNGFVTRNNPFVDRWSLILFLLFAITDTFVQIYPATWLLALTSLLAIAQAGLHGWRLSGWHHNAIWQKPMVWVLFMGYAWLVLGFFIKALTIFELANQSIVVHAMTVGGIGLISLGMMARVSLGHTGRNINEPPHQIFWIFGLAVAAAILRVPCVWLLPSFYNISILLAQISWIAAFGIFGTLFLPIWIRARPDGARG